jgi:hypothetical protein
LPPELVEIEKAEAEAALRAAAYTSEDRTLVHSFAGGSGILLGAEQDLEYAIERLGEADRVAWIDGPAGHDLAMQVGDRAYWYSARRPESAGD